MHIKPGSILAGGLLLGLLSGGQAMAAEGDLLQSGLVNFGLGVRECHNSDDVDCHDHAAVALDARMSFPVMRGLAVQADLQHVTNTGAQQASEQSMQATAAGAHLSWRDPRWFLVGGFAGLTRSGVRINDNVNPGASGLYWGKIYGLEAQAYIGQWVTLYGQYGRSNYHEGDNYFNAPIWRAVVRAYPTDKILIQGEVSEGKSKNGYEDYGDWGKARESAIEARMMVSDRYPLAVYVRYQYGTYTANTEDRGDEHTTLVGVSYSFGGAKTLLEQDRRGATLDLPMLPSRAASWAAVLD